jgi:tetratricopeptide (TPR) repeat protein
VTFSNASIASPVDKIRLSVEGEVPEVANFSYANEETFTALSVAQVPVASDGQLGAPSTIESFDVHHYTADSQEAREAIDAAADAIAEAEEAGADTEAAESSLGDAKAFYRNGDFDQALANAEEAETQAEDALDAKQSSEQMTQFIMIGVGVLVVLALAGGGYYWYKQNQQDTSRLG